MRSEVVPKLLPLFRIRSVNKIAADAVRFLEKLNGKEYEEPTIDDKNLSKVRSHARR